MFLLFAACDDPKDATPADPVEAPVLGLTAEGFDGQAPDPEGWRIRQNFLRDDGSTGIVEQFFVLTNGHDACERWASDFWPVWPEPTGDPEVDCPALQSWYEACAVATRESLAPGALEVFLYVPSDRDLPTGPHDGELPVGDWTIRDVSDGSAPGAGGLQSRYNWYAEVAASFDCSQAEAGEETWTEFPPENEEQVAYDGPSGSFAVLPLDEIYVTLDRVRFTPREDYADGEDGELSGAAHFTTCDIWYEPLDTGYD